MSRLDDLQIERVNVVEQMDVLRRHVVNLGDRLKETLPHDLYNRLAEERTTTIEALRQMERRTGELNREIRAERERESSAECGVSADDTAALLRVAAQIIGQIDDEDLTDAERSFLVVLQARVKADGRRARRTPALTTVGDAVLRRRTS